MWRSNRSLKPSRTPALHSEHLLGVAEAYQAQLSLASEPVEPPRGSVPSAGMTASQQLGHGGVSNPLYRPQLALPHATVPPHMMPPSDPWGASQGAPFGGAGSGYAMPVHLKSLEQIPPYPGQATSVPSLMCADRMGATIISSLTASGRDVEA